MDKFQFTHPVRGATDLIGKLVGGVIVSIHAPRAGCDLHASARPQKSRRFNSRPRVGCDTAAYISFVGQLLFQFTHPVRGATALHTTIIRITLVSIHAPRAGCDMASIYSRRSKHCFNSRTPCGVRPPDQMDEALRVAVSIHAPRAGCDVCQLAGVWDD